MASGNISRLTLQRLPTYLSYLKGLPEDGPPNISAAAIAAALELGEVQVRKDLASVSDAGKPKIGYLISGKTKLDILLTPLVSIAAGSAAGLVAGPPISSFMIW